MAERLLDVAGLEALTRFTIDVAGLGVRLDLERTTPQQLAHIQRRFSPARLIDVEPDFEVRVRLGEVAPAADDWESIEEFGIEIRYHAARTMYAPEHGAVLEAPEGGPIVITHRPDSNRSITSILVSLAIMVGSLDHGLHPHHAATVVDGDRVLLLLGASGQGKSTTSGISLGAGFDIQADDIVFIRPGDPPQAAGLPRSPAIPQDALPEGDPRRERPIDARGRVLLTDTRLYDRWLPVSAVAVVSHGEAHATEVTELSRAETLRHVVRSAAGSFELLGQPDLALDAAARLAALPTFGLLLGADASTRADTTAAALRELFDSLD